MSLPEHNKISRLQPINETFAKLPIEDALTWNNLAKEITDFRGGFLVVFRSRLRKNADTKLLNELDEAAFVEASIQKGFLGYFKGTLNTETLENLSCCLWTSRNDARSASLQPAHMAATRIVDSMYESYQLEFYNITIVPEVDAPLVVIKDFLEEY